MKGELKRHIGLIPLTFYGVGTILGAGIYVIISEVAATSGSFFPLSFIFASVVAVFAGLSYAELSARFPLSAGEAVYVDRAFGRKELNTIVGYAVALTGIVSASTILKGFHGYLELFFSSPQWLSISIMVVLLGAIAIKGIKESVVVVSIITFLEVSGLVLVIAYGVPQLDNLPTLINSWKIEGLNLTIFSGAFVAFFAFVGFEDMVNTAEEVVDAPKNMPRAIIFAIIISTFLYFIVSLVCAVSLPLDEISNNKAPLALMIKRYSSLSPMIMGAIGLVAILNGALVQMIMVSRMFYGMANLGVAPKVFGKVSVKTGTPILATLLTVGIIWVLSLSFPLGNLARITSFIILIVFGLISAALIKLKFKADGDYTGFQVPLYVPVLGLVSSLFFLFISLKAI